jgi:transposase
MESTGVYWKPLWNLLEGRFELLLVNAQLIKQVPGCKPDIKDCQWIAQFLQHGLLRPSFVPERPQRQLRDLTRQRVIRALIQGQSDPQAIADLARSRLRKKIPELRDALTGRVDEHHRFTLKTLMADVEHLESQIAAFDQRIDEVLGPWGREAVERLAAIPGINEGPAPNIIAEIGTDTGRFASAEHLASWAGMCPSNHRSAGKRKSGRTRPGDRWGRRTLVQTA